MPTLAPTRLRPSDLRAVTEALRRATNALAHPCNCGRTNCTIGEHVWRATRDGQPGARAQVLNDTPSSGPTNKGLEIGARPDPTAGDHDELNRLAASIYADAEALNLLLAHWRPDRHHDQKTSDADWCRHHLNTIGTCEPRYRGDLCRKCYDLQRSQRYLPPKAILEAWHRGDRVTAKMLAQHRPKRKRRR